MEIEKLACPSCGAPLPLPINREVITCSYCGNEVLIEDAQKGAGEGDWVDQLPDHLGYPPQIEEAFKPSGNSESEEKRNFSPFFFGVFRLALACLGGITAMSVTAGFLIFVVALAEVFLSVDNEGPVSNISFAVIVLGSLFAGGASFLLIMFPNAVIWNPLRTFLRLGKRRQRGLGRTDFPR